MSAQDRIQRRIAAFAEQLEALVRAEAIDAVRSALGQQPSESRASVAVAPVAGRTDMTPLTQPRSLTKGGKRDPKELDALTERVASYISANEGQRIEEIGKALSTPTKELALPIIRLLADNAVRKTGQKRATKYFAR